MTDEKHDDVMTAEESIRIFHEATKKGLASDGFLSVAREATRRVRAILDGERVRRLAAERDVAAARAERLAAALAPFAAYPIDSHPPSHDAFVLARHANNVTGDVEITIGHVRAARAALAAEPTAAPPAAAERVCAYCGGTAEGNYSIHRDGFCIGPEVDLCDEHGGYPHPTCPDIWERIAERIECGDVIPLSDGEGAAHE